MLSVKKILCHSYSRSGDIYASVQFTNPELARQATVIKDKNFFSDPKNKHLIKIESCRLLPRDSAFTSNAETHYTPAELENKAKLKPSSQTQPPPTLLLSVGAPRTNTREIASFNENLRSESSQRDSGNGSSDEDEATPRIRPSSSANIDSLTIDDPENESENESQIASSSDRFDEEDEYESEIPKTPHRKSPSESSANRGPHHATIDIPKVNYGRARRVLLLPNELLATVSMRGDVQFIHSGRR